jgi:Holliday junction resolvasome RuvABC ATP-dependent DNA helicase subunit
MSFRDRLLSTAGNSAAQLLSHAARAERKLPPARSVDSTAHDAALAEAERVLALHREELQGGELEDLRDRPPRLRPGIFDAIEGHELTKRWLRRALEAEQPTHILLVGPPGGGKTQFLQLLAGLPKTRYATGPTMSSSGLFAYLLERPQTKVLLIDELDKAHEEDRYILLTLMESGKLTRLQHQAIEEETRIVWVIAAANSAAGLPDALTSRFVVIELPAYTPAEVEQIARAVLVKREGIPPARARQIAQAVAARSSDPRDAVQIARLTAKGESIEAAVALVIPSKDRSGGLS